jgi:hypothetical protein
MAPRDVVALRARLTGIVDAARSLAANAEDLHVLAYDQPAGDEVKVAGGVPTSVYLDTVGNHQARRLWRCLEDELEVVETGLVALRHAVANLLSAGASAPVTRGSSLRPGELPRLLRRKAQRRAAGEYTPERTEAQPKYPGPKA